MARDPVVKAEILCHRARKYDVLSVLEKTGRVHLIDMSGIEDFPLPSVSEDEIGKTEELYSSLDRSIAFLKDRESNRKKRSKQVLPLADMDKHLQQKEIRSKVVRCISVSEELVNLQSRKQDLERQISFVRNWTDFPVNFDQINREGLFSVRAGQVSPRDGFTPLEKIEEETPLFHFSRLSDTRAMVMWHTEVEEKVLSDLAEAGFASEDFSSYNREPEVELSDMTAELSETNKRIEELNTEADSLTKLLPDMEALYDAAGLKSFRLGAAGSGRQTGAAVLLHTWVRRSDIPTLQKSLEKLGEVELTEIEHDPEETPPVFLSESASADPYIMLTDMYGRPQGADPDPTPLMAPFYAMFFGICIGDAGYGIALAAGAAAGWYITGKRGGNTRLFRLLFQGGLASVFWGVLLGGWFGMAFDKLPGFLQAAAMPLNNLVPGYTRGGEGFSLSNQFLYLTLGFGLVQLAWGIIVNLKKRLRAGEGLPAVVDQTGWMLALLGLFPWLFDHHLLNIYPNTGPLDSIFLGMLAVGALLIFIMGGREAAGLGGKVGLGAYACYGIVNLLGDVLSYSRLFALALSSAIIASVINQIAGMLSSSIPVLGFVLAVIVLAGGHLFNIGMAVLSGFIHTARLQFVEFFGKFYDGTGVPFTPLRYEPRYVRIER